MRYKWWLRKCPKVHDIDYGRLESRTKLVERYENFTENVKYRLLVSKEDVRSTFFLHERRDDNGKVEERRSVFTVGFIKIHRVQKVRKSCLNLTE